MKGFLSITSTLLALFSPAIQVCATSPAFRVPPSQDPFYTAPHRFEKETPGTVFRIRAAPGNYSQSIPNCSAAYHVLYRTTDARYRPSWAVTTLLLPPSYSAASAPATPLLSYQIPYNSPDIDASPSFDFSAMSTPGNPVSSALEKGWIVNVPDFEGPTASFGAGVQAGHATLDAVRAVLSVSREKKKHQGKPIVGAVSRYAMWGYSGGSIASEFAAELSVQYAPELSFAGAALGGLVPFNPVEGGSSNNLLGRINQTPYTGDIMAFLVGSLNQFPDAYQFLLDSLKDEGPYNRTGFLAVQKMTILEAFAFYAGQDVWEYFVQGQEVMNAAVVRKTLQKTSAMGYHGVPPMALYVYQAIGDKFSPIEETDALVERYCGNGAVIEYQRNSVGGHIAEITNGPPRALAWLEGVLEGTPIDLLTGGCDIKTVTVNITDVIDF